MSQHLKRRDFLWLSAASLASLGITKTDAAPFASLAGKAPARFEWAGSDAGVIYANDGTKLATLVNATIEREETVIGGKPVRVKLVKISAISHGWDCEEISFPLLLQDGNGAQPELYQVSCSVVSRPQCVS